jgi:hypothetical protein
MSERKAPIYRDRVYFLTLSASISGQERREVGAIASGATVKGRYTRGDLGLPSGLGNLNDGPRFRLDDGHLPEYQPRATFNEASKWVLTSGGTAFILPIETALSALKG